jgi:hypothetical protein
LGGQWKAEGVTSTNITFAPNFSFSR